MPIRLVFLFAVLVCFTAAAAEKPRVYVTDSDSWQISGGVAVADMAVGGAAKGGARPQTVEIMKTFAQRCPAVGITLSRDKADYIVLLELEGGKNTFLRDNKVAVFDKDEDLIYTGSTRSLGNAVKDACAAMLSSRKP